MRAGRYTVAIGGVGRAGQNPPNPPRHSSLDPGGLSELPPPPWSAGSHEAQDHTVLNCTVLGVAGQACLGGGLHLGPSEVDLKPSYYLPSFLHQDPADDSNGQGLLRQFEVFLEHIGVAADYLERTGRATPIDITYTLE